MGSSVEKALKQVGGKVGAESSRSTEKVSGGLIKTGGALQTHLDNLFTLTPPDDVDDVDVVSDTKNINVPTIADTAVQDALKLARGRRNAATGRQSTIRTGPTGLDKLSNTSPAKLSGAL